MERKMQHEMLLRDGDEKYPRKYDSERCRRENTIEKVTRKATTTGD